MGKIAHLSQRTKKPTIRLVWTEKIQISLSICTVWSESLLIACTVFSHRTIQRGINENSCHAEWMYRLIWVFAGHTGLILGFVVSWLIFEICTKKILLLFPAYWIYRSINPVFKLLLANQIALNNCMCVELGLFCFAYAPRHIFSRHDSNTWKSSS